MSGNVTVREYHLPPIRRRIPGFDRLPDRWRLRALRWFDPVHEQVVANTTVDDYHNALRAAVDPDVTRVAPEGTHIAIGNDDTRATTADSSLGNELDRTGFGSTSTTGDTVTISATFGSGSTANGNTIKEAAVVDDGQATLLNRVVLNTFRDKDSSNELTIDIDLGYFTRNEPI